MRRSWVIGLAVAAAIVAGGVLLLVGDDGGGRADRAPGTGRSPGRYAVPDGESRGKTSKAGERKAREEAAESSAPATVRSLVERGLAVGLSGEQPAALRDPRFRALGLSRARVVVSWDLVVRGARPGAAPDKARFPALADEHARLLAWLAAARATGVREVLLAVKSSRELPRQKPSRARYARSVRALLAWLDRAGHGDLVSALSAWNEPNLSSVTRSAPELAGSYFGVVREICASRRCTPVAGELADRPVTPAFLSRYLAGIGTPAPRIWAWHAYEDGWDRERDASFPRLRTLLAAIPAGAEVWLTEQGGIVRRRMPGDDGRSEQSEGRAAADLRFLLDRAPEVDERVKRFYVYQWKGDPAPFWDSGLIAPDGRAREAYCVFARAATARLPAACR